VTDHARGCFGGRQQDVRAQAEVDGHQAFAITFVRHAPIVILIVRPAVDEYVIVMHRAATRTFIFVSS
jgi:hypothetical protein